MVAQANAGIPSGRWNPCVRIVRGGSLPNYVLLSLFFLSFYLSSSFLAGQAIGGQGDEQGGWGGGKGCAEW